MMAVHLFAAHYSAMERMCPYMDAPKNASVFFGQFVAMRSGAVVHPVCLLRRFTCRGPVWRCEGRVRIDLASLKALRSIPGFPDPVSMTLYPYFVLRPATFLPALYARLLLRQQAPAPCRLPCSSSAPRQCAPSCRQAPPRPAYEACAPASGRATSPAARRAGPLSPPPSSCL